MTALARPIPSLKTLLLLAWPIVISRSSQVVVGVSDAILVSHLGEGAVAAVTTGALNTFAILILPMGICFIVSSFSSQLFGKGDLAGARRYGFYGLGIAGITQVVCMVGVLGVAPLLARLDYAPDVRALMIDYLALRLLSGGAAIGIEALANYYGGLSNTRLPMIASVVAMVLNVGGNYHVGCNRIYVKDFGTIYLAEMIVSPVDRRLALMRIEMGSPVGGDVLVGELGLDGHDWPP